MPEIGEVARIVHFIRKHLVGKTLAVVNAQHDEKVFGKVGTSAAEFEMKLRGKKVVDAGQQGKYFWLIMSEPPHPLMHFGMAGWFEIRHEITSYKKSAKYEDQSTWPPKYWRFAFETTEEPKCEAAFVDFRRFGRVRLIDCPAEDIRRVSPLKENGPDPVIDRELVTEEWFAKSLTKKKLRVKTFLLGQQNISGVGNWVGDEILYQAALHPEIYTNTLTPAQISRLYKSLIEVTSLAVETLADDTKFPESWLFKHRWNKGKKDILSALPKGGKVSYLTVGGRTTAIVASVQKKTDERKGEWDEIGNSEKEFEVESEEAVDSEGERAERKSKSEGEKTTNQTAEALQPEPTTAEVKHRTSEKPKRKTKLPVGATQDEEESQPDDLAETAAIEAMKAKSPSRKLKRKKKPAPHVEQEDEAESRPTSQPSLNTPNSSTKTNSSTGTKQEETKELPFLADPPTRKSSRKSNLIIPATPNIPTLTSSSSSQAPPNPTKKNKNNNNNASPLAAHVVYPSSSSKTQKREINPSTDEEDGALSKTSNNTVEKTSKKIKTTTMRTSGLQPQEKVGQVGSSSSHINEDIWEGRRRSRRVSGRGVSPVGGNEI